MQNNTYAKGGPKNEILPTISGEGAVKLNSPKEIVSVVDTFGSQIVSPKYITTKIMIQINRGSFSLLSQAFRDVITNTTGNQTLTLYKEDKTMKPATGLGTYVLTGDMDGFASTQITIEFVPNNINDFKNFFNS
jgi:hypothetical protein